MRKIRDPALPEEYLKPFCQEDSEQFNWMVSQRDNSPTGKIDSGEEAQRLLVFLRVL